MPRLKFFLSVSAAGLAATAVAQVDTGTLMKVVIIPASEQVFAVGKAVPRGDAEWIAVEQNAEKLAAASQRLGSLAPGNAGADWARYSAAMGDAARAAAKAAREKNVDRVLDAGDEINESCEGCHKRYLKR